MVFGATIELMKIIASLVVFVITTLLLAVLLVLSIAIEEITGFLIGLLKALQNWRLQSKHKR